MVNPSDEGRRVPSNGRGLGRSTEPRKSDERGLHAGIERIKLRKRIGQTDGTGTRARFDQMNANSDCDSDGRSNGLGWSWHRPPVRWRSSPLDRIQRSAADGSPIPPTKTRCPTERTHHRSAATRARIGPSQTERAPTRIRWRGKQSEQFRGSAHQSERHRSQSQPERTSNRTNGHHWQSRADREADSTPSAGPGLRARTRPSRLCSTESQTLLGLLYVPRSFSEAKMTTRDTCRLRARARPTCQAPGYLHACGMKA